MTVDEPKRYETFIKLCAYYDQPLNFGNTDMLHPKTVEAKKYFMKIPFELIDSLYDKITGNCEFFPSRAKLSEIYNSMVQYHTPERIGVDNQLTMENAGQKFIESNHAPVECPAENAALTGKDMERDSRVLTDDQMMKKYGFKRMYAFWKEQADKLTDEEWAQRDRERDERARRHFARDSFYTKSLDDVTVKATVELFQK